MIKPSITIQEAVDYLNSLIECDRDAIERLIEQRVPCNLYLAKHPTCQVLLKDGENYVGLLGILNGLFGVDKDGWGAIAATYDGNLQNFCALNRNSTCNDKE